MRLCIADPPYPPYYAERHDLVGGGARVTVRSRAMRYYSDDGVRCSTEKQADHHPEASEWDDPARHRLLLEQLLDEYDGWVIATCPDGLDHYRPLPIPHRLMVWVRPNAAPSSTRVASTWEPVILYPPIGRRAHPRAGAGQVPDVLVCPGHRIGFPGSKPERWTRWVLDAMGYDPEVDELVDLFPGSGSVAAAASQGVLL